jgi:hypothetical protein
MHTYRKSKDEQLWTVGHYKMIGDEHFSSEHEWEAMKDFAKEDDAAAYVNYLNGGTGGYSK